jgi:hypothetical protein
MIALLSLCSLPFLQGCSTCEVNRDIQAPPQPNGGAVREFGNDTLWLLADINDLIFGVDYFCELEKRFNTCPYR